MKIYDIPKVFQPKVRVHFPDFQRGEELEWQAWEYMKKHSVQSTYIYFPVLWCPFYVNNKYGTDRREMDKLRGFIRHLPKKPMVTVNIYDGWPIETERNMVVFSGSGLPDHSIPLPLICDPHPGADSSREDRPILCSSTYSVGTHPVRQQILDAIGMNDGCYMKASETGRSVELFRELMQKSVFAMAPRGSGKTSFRMYEALQFGAIPVYVSDSHWIPFQDEIDWEKLAVIWPCERFEELYGHLVELYNSGKAAEMREYGRAIYDRYFTYEGCFSTMKRIIERDYR